MPETFNAGAWLWLETEDDSWIPVRASSTFAAGQEGSASTEDGASLSIGAKASAGCHLMDEQSLGELEDMTQFNDLSEGPLLHNLRKRYGKDGIYTWVGSILVAVNPFQVLPNCYTPENLARYVRSDGGKDLPPHCYSIASMAHTALVRDRRSQAICISGESGAGKTESMKLMLGGTRAQAQASARPAKRAATPRACTRRRAPSPSVVILSALLARLGPTSAWRDATAAPARRSARFAPTARRPRPRRARARTLTRATSLRRATRTRSRLSRL